MAGSLSLLTGLGQLTGDVNFYARVALSRTSCRLLKSQVRLCFAACSLSLTVWRLPRAPPPLAQRTSLFMLRAHRFKAKVTEIRPVCQIRETSEMLLHLSISEWPDGLGELSLPHDVPTRQRRSKSFTNLKKVLIEVTSGENW